MNDVKYSAGDEMTVFVCPDSLDGILTGIYEAWDSRLGHGRVRLEVGREMTLELFCRYQEVRTDLQKAEKVLRTIERRLGEAALIHICQAAAGAEPQKADAIYRMVVLGLSLERGSEIVNCLTYGPVAEVMRLSQKTWHEVHKLMGFVRFSELYNGVLYAPIESGSQALPFLAPHFEDRLRHENWMIHDVKHYQVAVHQADRGWVLVEDEGLDTEKLAQMSEREERYVELWKSFHESIAISARANTRLQRQLLPLRYRPHMTEFSGTDG